MDKAVKKLVLWKCRNIDKLYENLQRMKERKEEIIDESSSVPDGQPKAKYNVSDMVSNKVLRREQIDFSIKKLEYEIHTIIEFKNSLKGYEREIYDSVIERATNINAKADLLGYDRKKILKDKSKLLRQLATELGEYVDIDY